MFFKITGQFWKHAFQKVMWYRGTHKIRSVLFVSAAGEEKSKNTPSFHGVTLARAEYDSKMKFLAPLPNGIFDLILFDGSVTPELLSASDSAFLTSLEEKLNDTGLLVVCVYGNATFLDVIGRQFAFLRMWEFVNNHFGLFQKKTILTALQNGYVPVREWPELNTIETMPKFSTPSRIGKNGEGIYWQLWPFSFENYYSDTEPNIIELPAEKKRPIRIIMWQRRLYGFSSSDWQIFSKKPFLKTGFAPLVDSQYVKHWSETARRELKKWRTVYFGTVYVVRSISYDEFAKGYLKSTLGYLLRQSMLFEVSVRTKNEKTPVAFYGVERISDKKLVAGLAVMESPSLSISYYLAGFFTKDAEHDPVMTGLFDFWFQDAIARGLKFIDFGNFWKPGDESSWKGFSMFKAKFNPLYFFYPAKLYKFRWGK